MPAFTAEAVIADLTRQVRQVVAASPRLTVRERLREAARTLRLPISRVADWNYGEVRRVEAQEADQIRHYASQRQRRLAAAEQHYRELRAELVDHAPRFVARLAPPALPDRGEADPGRVPGQRRSR